MSFFLNKIKFLIVCFYISVTFVTSYWKDLRSPSVDSNLNSVHPKTNDGIVMNPKMVITTAVFKLNSLITHLFWIYKISVIWIS